MTGDEFRKLALSFPGTEDAPHFDKIAFKTNKIFATLHEPSNTANLKFVAADQPVFCSFDNSIVYPVPNKWGLQGWTTFELKKIPAELMFDALDCAYKNASKTKKKKR
jgi:YjbR protein